MIKKLAPTFLIVFLAISCLEEPDCIGLNNDVIGITFKQRDGTQIVTQKVTFQSVVANNSLQFVGVDRDTVISKILLPLDFLNQQTAFELKSNDSIYNVVFGYKAQAQFVSEDCGQRYVLSDLKVLSHNFDSVVVVSNRPGADANVNNLEVYLE